MSPAELSRAIKEKAQSLGFALANITGDVRGRDREFYNWWVDQGFGADMFYLRAQKERRKSITEILPGAKSVIVCALRFPGAENTAPPLDETEKAYGKVARYALHEDYHERLKPLLDELATFLATLVPQKSLTYVDTGAIPERALAKSAGLGWIGKNSMLIHPEEGSWFWLGEILTTAEIAADLPINDHCGKCRRCIDACPTHAIFEEIRAIDSRKCLAYWNIEHRGAIPEQFHEPMQNLLVGCDICQEVCPWNEHSLRKGRKDIGAPPAEWVAVDEILSLTVEEFKKQYKERAISRLKISGIQRNAAIIQKNFEKRKQ